MLFLSKESLSATGGPVFNRVAYVPGSREDVWVMQQSHEGLVASPHAWDRIAIVVDHTTSPRVARYYQLEPGPLEWTVKAKRIDYRASCFLCHSGGPRAIRPQQHADLVSALRVAAWNLRIKTYGRVVNEGTRPESPTPFRHLSSYDNEILRAPTCLKCHNETSRIRGPLTRQNFMPIRHLLKEGHMPPPGFSLSPEERAAIEQFLRGQAAHW